MKSLSGRPVIFSGIQPTGNLHLGNYLGAVKNWLDLQNSGQYDCYFCIVDYHSLVGNMDAKSRREQTIRTAAELLALGIDPKKSTFFIQSYVPEHTELGWVFNTVTPLGELRRMTQFKDKSGISGMKDNLNNEYRELIKDAARDIVQTYKNKPIDDQRVLAEKLFPLQDAYPKINDKFLEIENKAVAGLFTYPVLQAADILLYKGTLVPVGQDQIQHIELTRNIARWFNNKYGEYFPETKHLLTEVPKVMSLLEPMKKMSKSLGADHVIELADSPEEIERKLKRAVTATEGGAEAPGVQNLLLLLRHFGELGVAERFAAEEKTSTIRYGELKTALAEACSGSFADFRRRREKLLKSPAKIEKLLAVGAKRARRVAVSTMKDVRRLVGIR